jgi:hypothetical protein
VNAPARGTIRATILIVGGVLAIAFVIESLRPTQAMPVFAQAYGINCEVCHSSVPALNAYGRYVQRTDYSSLDASTIHKAFPLWGAEAVYYDTQDPTYPHYYQTGNLSLHGAGYIGSDITWHLHQWIQQNDQPGGTDTLWLTYNNLLHRDGHLTIGKLELPAPSPFSQWFELSGFAPPSMTVGEHAYGLADNRWGAKMQYIRPGYIAEAAYVTTGDNLNTAFDWESDRTFQYRLAYARADKPVEAGVYGATGSYPLSDGSFDNYSAIGPYIEIDSQHGLPGLFALVQNNNDSNAGPAFGPAHSYGYTIDVFEPLYKNVVMLGVRKEMTNDGLGTITQYGNVDLEIVMSRHVSSRAATAWTLNGEMGMQSGLTPAWRMNLQFDTTFGALH